LGLAPIPREQNLAFEVAIAAIAGFSSHGHDTTTRPRCHPVGLSDRGMGDMAGLAWPSGLAALIRGTPGRR
jgi:hypothetical protein